MTLVQLRDPADWAFAKVARAVNPAPYPITATYSLTEQPFVLWEWPNIYKTGRGSGTTQNPDILGNQTDYCWDWYVPNTNRTVLCQTVMSAGLGAIGGDSGGPVWGQYGSQYVAGEAFLVGLAVGGGPGLPVVISPAGGLAWDFGYDSGGGFISYYTCVGVGFCF